MNKRSFIKDTFITLSSELLAEFPIPKCNYFVSVYKDLAIHCVPRNSSFDRKCATKLFQGVARFAEPEKTSFQTHTLRKLYFHVLSHWMGYDRGDNFPFNFEPNGILFGLKSKGKLSPRSYPIQCGRKWNYCFLSVTQTPSSEFMTRVPIIMPKIPNKLIID